MTNKKAIFPLCLLLIALFAYYSPGCKANSPDTINDYEKCVRVISAAYEAFNAYDLEKCLTYVTPSFRDEARPALADNMKQFEGGRALRIRLEPVFGDAVTQNTDSLSLAVTMRVGPNYHLYPDQYYLFDMVKINGEWMIAGMEDDSTRQHN
jgi:hypothetical protein